MIILCLDLERLMYIQCHKLLFSG